eukprot:Pompholyxophrys_sp_v1_NODE_4_length_15125_cov_6.573656.p15 type:complete len:102 gc:universal NODE_4_length_15125_cov_6.573656:8834-9139(+)
MHGERQEFYRERSIYSANSATTMGNVAIQGLDCSGNDIGLPNTSVYDPMSCLNICQGTVGCVAGIYDNIQLLCWKKSACNNPSASSSSRFYLPMSANNPQI